MTSPSVVRPAAPADEAELWRLFRLMHAENALYTLSERKVKYHLDRVLSPEKIPSDDFGPRGFAGVIGAVGALEGAIMLMLGSPWYSEETGMDDCVNFVDPAHRRSNHARALLEYAKHIVDQIRLAHPDFKMISGVVSTKRTAAKARLYERYLAPVGVYFVYPTPSEFEPLKHIYRTR